MVTALFDLVAERLEHYTGFDHLEARGTLRLALKSAGLDPNSFDVGQRRVVFGKLMPGEPASSPLPVETDSASDLDGAFRRLGGD